jgi:hypothetical protein
MIKPFILLPVWRRNHLEGRISQLSKVQELLLNIKARFSEAGFDW